MPELLLELVSEEIPARMQVKAAGDLQRLITDGLVAQGLLYEAATAHVTPRRLVLMLDGLSAKAADVKEQRKGPRIDAPEKAIEGFLKSAGVTREQCIVKDDKKGSFLVAEIDQPGRSASAVLAELVPEIIRKFPWPKSMRWGSGSLRWVRPLKSILCCFDGDVVTFEIDGITNSNESCGHRFMAPATFNANNFEDYVAKLQAGKVMLSAQERADSILAQAKTLAFAQGLELIEDKGLINETAGLVEWPTVLMGEFDDAFLDVPPEVIITTIKTHQKCFALRQANGKLANRYLLVSNLEAVDGGQKIIAGNNRVIAARLADAKFFWDQDRKTGLQDRLVELENITFHAKLGTQAQRVERLENLAAAIATIIGADGEQARLAAKLCKADLVTGMVGEFPELQGLMGGYYARIENQNEQVANAIRDHYKPQGPSDNVPEGKISQAVALADKLDILTGFWAIDEKPTGSKDPYALRRAALGVIRIVLEGDLRVPFSAAFFDEIRHNFTPPSHTQPNDDEAICEAVFDDSKAENLMAFFADRLSIYLRDQGARHDLIDAVFALKDHGQPQDDLLLIVRRVEALGRFLDSEDGKNLLAGVKRASNILRIEEKKDGVRYSGKPAQNLLVVAEEKALYRAIAAAQANAAKAVATEDFAAAMQAIAKLRQPVDGFFDKVTVNADDPSFRENRLKLLNMIREATLTVADFSHIEG